MALGGWDSVVRSSQEAVLQMVTTSWKPMANREPSAEKQQQPGTRLWYTPTKSHNQEAPSSARQTKGDVEKGEERKHGISEERTQLNAKSDEAPLCPVRLRWQANAAAAGITHSDCQQGCGPPFPKKLQSHGANIADRWASTFLHDLGQIKKNKK